MELLMEIKSKKRTTKPPEYCFSNLHCGWWKEIHPAAAADRHGRVVNNNPGCWARSNSYK
jgi:hypothetical protein